MQKAFVNFRQKRDMTVGEYHEKFKSLVSAYEGCGGSVGNDKGLIVEYLVRMGTYFANADANDVKAAKKGAREEYMATLFIVNSDKSRFGNLIQELENDFVKSNDNYPGTLTGAYTLLANRKEDPRYQFASATAQDNSIAFVQANDDEEASQDEEGDGTGDKTSTALVTNTKFTGKKVFTKEPAWLKDAECWKCGEKGHTKNTCTKPAVQATEPKEKTGVAQVSYASRNDAYDSDDSDGDFAFLSHGYCATGVCSTPAKDQDQHAEAMKKLRKRLKEKRHGISIWWLLLDSEATNHVFCNRKLIKNVQYCPTGLIVHGHSGSSKTHLHGTVG